MAAPVTTRPPGPRFGISLAVLLVGVVAAVVGVVMIVSAVFSIINGPTYRVPATLRIHLDSGDYKIYEYDRFGTSGDFRSAPPLVDSSSVRIVGPGGSPVPVFPTSTSETIATGSDAYAAVARFDAPSSGTYTVRVRTDAATRIRIEHPLADIAKDNAVWVLLIVAGGLVMLVGFVMVVVGLVRRGSAKRRAATLPAGYAPAPGAPNAWPPADPNVTTPGAPPTAPAATPPVPAAPAPPPPTVAPAGWFPDPSGAHRLRYWDGQAWTEHIAD